MRFADPAALWWALLAVPVVLLHVLRPRRPPRVVSSTLLWRAVERPVTSAVPFRMLRPSWLLLLQLLAVGLLTAALADPVRVEATPLAEHTVFLIDGSGSMLALDGRPDRIADARARAVRVRRDLPAGGIASVIEVGPQPRVLLSASADTGAFDEAVAATRASPGRAGFAAAFALAEGLETADAPIGFVLVSDGGLSEEEQRLLPPGATYEQVGSGATNRGVTALDVEARPTELHVRVTVANTGGPAAVQTLRLDVDGRTRQRVELDLAVGETRVYETDLTAGDRVDAFLEGEDLLAADNRRVAVSRRRQPIRVQVVGEPDPFLDALLQAVDGLSLVSGVEGDRPDLVVYNRSRVPSAPSTPFIAIRAPGGAPGLSVVGEAEGPALTLVRSDEALLGGIDLSGLAVATAQQVRSDTAEVLLAAESAPLLLRGRAGGVRFAYLAFGLSDSNLPLQTAFPLLGERLLAELTGARLPPASIEVGETLTLPSQSGGVLTDPAGTVVELAPGSPGLVVERPGLWSVAVPGRPETLVAVNPAATESGLTPVPGLPTELRPLRPGEPRTESYSSLRLWAVAAALAAVAAEFLLARRRVGVAPLQWRLANAVRTLVVLALLGALIDAGYERDAGEVATVFVVDASDSLGTRGRAEAVSFVTQALAAQPDGARAGVVMFGGDARIELLLRREASFLQPSVRVDPSRTDLAAALRLGGAVLPSDARRRVVLVSDGRATDGDAAREAARLRDQGISVDTVLIDTPGSADIAIGAVRAPSRVSQGERIPIGVALQSTLEGPAVVTLRVDGEVAAVQRLDVVAGAQSVTFTDIAAGGGLRRYRVDVESAADAVTQNNHAFAAVEVAGPARVLVVEGVSGNGAELAGALEAGGLEVDTVPVSGIPQMDGLLAYSSILLVDVDQRQLSNRQVGALSGAVRDGGRGLVTLGGNQSYGLGGYYTSELERLLPVVSEILDPLRRQTVAEVLAIDTSGSMGACHCSENDFVSNRIDGGVNKTDISRAAAARTIAALGSNDEIGVLAFDVEERWVLELQKLPAQDVVNQGLAMLNPDGGTNPSGSLQEAASALRQSNAALKHIILFTDGFTAPALLDGLADEASALAGEGITVSVVATGEGAAGDLEAVAQAGRGRFYPGRDLQQIPQLIMDEAVLASRDFINEGEFLPTVTSSLPVVAGLRQSPPLLGYVATTARPRAVTLLEIGPDADPLLARWQVGLGTVTSWTSDASQRWSRLWAGWDGYVGFWSRVVRDSFPTLDDSTTAVVDDGVLRIRVEADGGFGDSAAATARITDPALAGRRIGLSRVGPDTFVGELVTDEAGVYVVGTSVSSADGSVIQGTAIASQPYGREYEPGVADGPLLARIAEAGSGRAGIEPAMAFDAGGLVAGRSRVALARWLLLAAAVLFVTAVVLSRLTPAPLTQSGRPRSGRLRLRRARPAAEAARGGARDRPDSTVQQDARLLEELAQAEEAAQTSTLSALLDRTRDKRSRD